MKIGAEDKKEMAIMTVLLAVLLVVGVYNFRGVLWAGDAAQSPSLAYPKGPVTVTAAQDDEPWLNLRALQLSREVGYELGRNPFAMQQAPAEHKQPTQIGQLVDWPKPDPPPPPPPKIPLAFYGFANKPGEPKRIFLAQGEQNFVAVLNDIVDRQYKVVRIDSNQVIMEDMLNNKQQPVALTPR